MRIVDAHLHLTSQHVLHSEYHSEVLLRTAHGSFRRTLAEVSANPPVSLPETAPPRRLQQLLERLLIEVLARLRGEPAARGVPGPAVGTPSAALPATLPAIPSPAAAAPDGTPRGVRLAGSVEFAWHAEAIERVHETERSEFTARGSVRTADGRSVDFALALAMSREFRSERSATESGQMVMRDPLVINFNGSAAELVGTRFDFDLDLDGQRESLPRLAAGSAFLALDRNGDGRINDGSELFGARSGDGFADLAGLDDDGNGWLDEADAAFAALCVWQPPSADTANDSPGTLDPLAAHGVGALCLSAQETPFALRDADNRPLGQVRASGIYLREDGTAGTLQQVDLAV